MAAWLSAQIVANLAARLPTVSAHSLLLALQTSGQIDTLGLTMPWSPDQQTPPMFPRSTSPYGWFSTPSYGQPVLADPMPFNTFQARGMPG